jgi:hypothetical protein
LTGTAGVTPGPRGTGTPSPILFGDDINVGYVDIHGNVWDVSTSGNDWVAQPMAGPKSNAGGPAAYGSPALLSVDGAQIYYCYFDADGNLHAAWLEPASGSTTLQLAGGPGSATSAPAGEGDITTVFFQGQSFIFYRAKTTPNTQGSAIYLLWATYGSPGWSAMTIAGYTEPPAQAG